MLTPTHIARYGIIGIYDSYAATDELFSGEGKDPHFDVNELNKENLKGVLFDLVVAIGADGKCVIQTILFKNKLGYEKYKRESVLIFEHKEF